MNSEGEKEQFCSFILTFQCNVKEGSLVAETIDPEKRLDIEQWGELEHDINMKLFC